MLKPVQVCGDYELGRRVLLDLLLNGLDHARGTDGAELEKSVVIGLARL